jgi:hypothetical protein
VLLVNIRWQSTIDRVYLLFTDSDWNGIFFAFPLFLSIATTILLDRFLTHALIWEIICFNLGMSLAMSTIVTTILASLGNIFSISNAIRDILAFLFWDGSFWCISVGACLGIVSATIASIISIAIRIH